MNRPHLAALREAALLATGSEAADHALQAAIKFGLVALTRALVSMIPAEERAAALEATDAGPFLAVFMVPPSR